MKKYWLHTIILISHVILMGIFSSHLLAAKPKTKPITSVDEYRKMRLEKLNQPRSLIFNNDGCDAITFPEKFLSDWKNNPNAGNEKSFKEALISRFLKIRTENLIGSDVNTISYCTLASGFGLFTHDTKVGETFTRDARSLQPGRMNIVPEFLKLGTDPLKITEQYAHSNKLEFFWSNRMNDTHDAYHSQEKPHLLFPKMKEEHPEYLFGTTGEKLPYGNWSSVDYSLPEIRDLCVKFYEEVCENYDVDGVELDFFRHLNLFRNVAQGDSATSEQLDMFTNMVSRIRMATENIGMKKGKPILVLVRVPDSFEYAEKMGIDLKSWIKQGLVDIVVGSDYFRLNTWDHLIGFCHQHSIKFYANINDPRVKKEHTFLNRKADAVYRARAAAAWQAGVDGIYSFNEYVPDRQYLSEIGNANKIARKNNLYFVTYLNMNPNFYLKNGNGYLNLPVLTPVNPVALSTGTETFTVEIGDESNPSKISFILYADGISPQNLKVSINSKQISYKKHTEDGLIIFDIPDDTLKPGKNHIEISLADQGSQLHSKPMLLDAAVLFYRNKSDQDRQIKNLAGICGF